MEKIVSAFGGLIETGVDFVVDLWRGGAVSRAVLILLAMAAISLVSLLGYGLVSGRVLAISQGAQDGIRQDQAWRAMASPYRPPVNPAKPPAWLPPPQPFSPPPAGSPAPWR
jgi:hypothetical protein